MNIKITGIGWCCGRSKPAAELCRQAAKSAGHTVEWSALSSVRQGHPILAGSGLTDSDLQARPYVRLQADGLMPVYLPNTRWRDWATCLTAPPEYETQTDHLANMVTK